VTNEEAHRFARAKGVSRPLYALVRAIVAPFLRLYFRMHVSGVECVPATGAATIAPNHKSFLDSFFIAVCIPRQLRFMAKTELIEARYGGLLVRLGAFPVRRGRSDADALESGAPLVPCAITGTERLFLGPLPKPRRVQVAFSEPIHVAQLASIPEAAARVVDEALWPEVEGEFRRLRARPTLVAAALAAIGIGGGLLVRRRRRPRSRLPWRR
jgi:1-acyl-sn-glycerol-3-phosphate acyltransferase